jgi:mannose-6-phosphate isomerase class I
VNLDFKGILEAIKHLPPGEQNLKDRFLRDTDWNTCLGIAFEMLKKARSVWKEDEEKFYEELMYQMDKKVGRKTAIVADYWRQYSSKNFIEYLTKQMDMEATLRQNIETFKKIVASISEAAAKPWLETLEELDSRFLSDDQELTCYLLRASLKNGYWIYTRAPKKIQNYEE